MTKKIIILGFFLFLFLVDKNYLLAKELTVFFVPKNKKIPELSKNITCDYAEKFIERKGFFKKCFFSKKELQEYVTNTTSTKKYKLIVFVKNFSNFKFSSKDLNPITPNLIDEEPVPDESLIIDSIYISNSNNISISNLTIVSKISIHNSSYVTVSFNKILNAQTSAIYFTDSKYLTCKYNEISVTVSENYSLGIGGIDLQHCNSAKIYNNRIYIPSNNRNELAHCVYVSDQSSYIYIENNYCYFGGIKIRILEPNESEKLTFLSIKGNKIYYPCRSFIFQNKISEFYSNDLEINISENQVYADSLTAVVGITILEFWENSNFLISENKFLLGNCEDTLSCISWSDNLVYNFSNEINSNIITLKNNQYTKNENIESWDKYKIKNGNVYMNFSDFLLTYEENFILN